MTDHIFNPGSRFKVWWYSVRGIYASIANLPRQMCYKQRYTTLLGVIPGGGHEPSNSQINKVLKTIKDDLLVSFGIDSRNPARS
jgi:hypothetical protein